MYAKLKMILDQCCLQVLFFEQVRTAVNGGLLLSDQVPGHIHHQAQQQQQSEYIDESNNSNSNNEENWETVHQDFTALKGDLASIKVRIAEAERERQDATSGSKHMKAKGVLSGFKPEKLFNKLFANRGFSSSESSRDSISPEVVPTPSVAGSETTTTTMTMKQQLRHSIA